MWRMSGFEDEFRRLREEVESSINRALERINDGSSRISEIGVMGVFEGG